MSKPGPCETDGCCGSFCAHGCFIRSTVSRRLVTLLPPADSARRKCERHRFGRYCSNEGTDAPTASAEVLVDPEQEAFSPLAPQPPSVLHCGSQCLQKALDAAAKERECEDLKLWRPAIINHLYWTAASTHNGDPDVMEAKWQDIYEHGTLEPAYASALMESLTEGHSRSPKTLRESSAVLSSTAPAPLSRSCQKINKDEAVGLYLARHSRFNTGH